MTQPKIPYEIWVNEKREWSHAELRRLIRAEYTRIQAEESKHREDAHTAAMEAITDRYVDSP